MKILSKLLVLLAALTLSVGADAHHGRGGINGTAPAPPVGGCLATATTLKYDGCISVNSSGLLVNGHGVNIQLRGATDQEMENTIYNSTPPTEQCYVGFTSNGGPPMGTAGTQWRFNYMRITMNVGAFLNIQAWTAGGSASSPTWGANTQSDPNAVYKRCLINSVLLARANGMYWQINDHFSAPSFTFGGVNHNVVSWGQPLFASADQSLPYWTAAYGTGPGVTDGQGFPSSSIPAFLASQFGSAAFNTAHSIPGAGGVVGAAGQYWNSAYGGTTGFNDGIFELFNEPYLEEQSLNYNTAKNGAGSSVTTLSCMLNGCWVSAYCNLPTGGAGNLNGFGTVGIPNSLYGSSGQPNTTGDPFCFNWWWQATGYQAELNGIRALGATNVVAISGPAYATGESNITQYFPTDSLSPRQEAVNWHPYGGTYPNTSDPNGNFSWNGSRFGLQVIQNIIAGSSSYTVNGTNLTGLGFPVPVIASEFGPQNSTTTPDTNTTSIISWADGNADPNTGTASPGVFSTGMWAYPASGGPASFGTSNPGQSNGGWNMIILGATHTITGSISTSVPSGCVPAGCAATFGTLTVTNANGNNLAPSNGNQWCITGGASTNSICIYQQLTGTAGGIGTYAVSFGVTQGSTTLTIQQWNCAAGEGCTYFNWSSVHSELLPITLGIEAFQDAANDDQFHLRRAA